MQKLLLNLLVLIACLRSRRGASFLALKTKLCAFGIQKPERQLGLHRHGYGEALHNNQIQKTGARVVFSKEATACF
jgi:hypothetical protein